ncbi:MAG: hypothetical protein RL693_1025 [Verrucomicrobiota bacterium]|jgi:hypothetical protein
MGALSHVRGLHRFASSRMLRVAGMMLMGCCSVAFSRDPLPRAKPEPVPEPPPVYVEAPNPPANDFEVNMKRVFADDQLADIRVTFGYEDAEDLKNPSDPARALHLMQYLQSHRFEMINPTEELAKELGVRLEAPNLRILQVQGSIGQTLRISLIWSAATSSTPKNIGSGRKEQWICSDEALKFMQKAASDAEIMFYIGHSRAGGGPDTFPPQTLPSNGGKFQQVDFGYYGNTQPGLAALSPYFGKNKDNPKFIALTGCRSDRHFHQWLARRLAGHDFPTSVILSTRLTRSMPWENNIDGCDEALMVLVNLIETLQQHRTESEFKGRMKSCEIEEMRESKDAWKLITIPEPDAGSLADKGKG